MLPIVPQTHPWRRLISRLVCKVGRRLHAGRRVFYVQYIVYERGCLSELFLNSHTAQISPILLANGVLRMACTHKLVDCPPPRTCITNRWMGLEGTAAEQFSCMCSIVFSRAGVYRKNRLRYISGHLDQFSTIGVFCWRGTKDDHQTHDSCPLP